jgi:hypothetical protein
MRLINCRYISNTYAEPSFYRPSKCLLKELRRHRHHLLRTLPSSDIKMPLPHRHILPLRALDPRERPPLLFRRRDIVQLRDDHHDRRSNHIHILPRPKQSQLLVRLQRDAIAEVGVAQLDRGFHEVVRFETAGSAGPAHADGVVALGRERRDGMRFVASELGDSIFDELCVGFVGFVRLDVAEERAYHDDRLGSSVGGC